MTEAALSLRMCDWQSGKSKSEEHRKIIDDYAKKGYRYVGYIPTVMTDYGKIKDMDLIFELDI